MEDEPETWRMFQVLLPDFEIVPAGSRLEAISNLMEQDYSLIFMDYYLPDGTGEEACQHIRVFDTETPILFVTASPTFTDKDAVSAGAQGVLRKASPTFVDKLRQYVNDLVHGGPFGSGLASE